MSRLAAFERDWLPHLEGGAKVLFRHGVPSDTAFTHTAIADEFVQSLGLKPIGFHWELLDAAAPEGEARSALGEITTALSQDLANPSKPWLNPEIANQCAHAFCSLFDDAGSTIVSNRYDGLWNPIAGGGVEWGFVGFDSRAIALLLLVGD